MVIVRGGGGLCGGSRTLEIAASIFDWEKWWILSTTTRGDLIITEGFNPNSSPPLNGRPSVYLDQNRWRTVADGLRDRIAWMVWVCSQKYEELTRDSGSRRCRSRLLTCGLMQLRSVELTWKSPIGVNQGRHSALICGNASGQVGAGSFRAVECSSGLSSAHVCSSFAPRRAPRQRGSRSGTRPSAARVARVRAALQRSPTPPDFEPRGHRYTRSQNRSSPASRILSTPVEI